MDDYKPAQVNQLIQGAESMGQARKATNEVVKVIADTLARTEFHDLDTLLDILFMKEENGYGERVSKSSLREYILDDMRCPVDSKDLDIFLRTNQILQGKEIVSRTNVKQVFEQPFRKARAEMIEKTATAT